MSGCARLAVKPATIDHGVTILTTDLSKNKRTGCPLLPVLVPIHRPKSVSIPPEIAFSADGICADRKNWSEPDNPEKTAAGLFS